MCLPGDPKLIPFRTSRSGYTTILTCRDQERGGKLVKEIAQESGVRSLQFHRETLQKRASFSYAFAYRKPQGSEGKNGRRSPTANGSQWRRRNYPFSGGYRD